MARPSPSPLPTQPSTPLRSHNFNLWTSKDSGGKAAQCGNAYNHGTLSYKTDAGALNGKRRASFKAQLVDDKLPDFSVTLSSSAKVGLRRAPRRWHAHVVRVCGGVHAAHAGCRHAKSTTPRAPPGCVPHAQPPEPGAHEVGGRRLGRV